MRQSVGRTPVPSEGKVSEAKKVSSDVDQPVWLRSLKSSWPFIVITLLVAFFAGLETVAKGLERTLVLLHLKEETALELAHDTARSQFSDALTRLQWRRFYWTQRYVSALAFELPGHDQAEIWKSYLTTVEEWTTNSMVNILGLESYYGPTKRNDFELGIMRQFAELHDCLLRLKYPEHYRQRLDRSCKTTTTRLAAYEPTIGEIQNAIDALNLQLYCFAAGLSQKNESCYILRSGGANY